MDPPHHVDLRDDDSCSSPMQQQDPPEIHVILPCVPDLENSGEDDDDGMNNPVFTVEEVARIFTPVNHIHHPFRDEWVSIPMNGIGGGVCRDDPEYLTAKSILWPHQPTSRSWDKLSLASSGSPTMSHIHHSFDVDRSSFIYEKIRSLVAAFQQRALNIKQNLMRPTTPASVSSDISQTTSTAAERHRRYSKVTCDSSFLSSEVDYDYCKSRGCLEFFNPLNAVEPQSKFYVIWLFLVSLCYLYNAWSIFLRAAFYREDNSRDLAWFVLNCVSDIVYLIDLVAFKVRLKVLSKGFWITDIKRTWRIYVQSWNFVFDASSQMPLDLICYWLGQSNSSLLRLPRLLKIHTFWEFFDRFDHIASSPYIIRIVHTLMYMIFLIHINACAYYAYSDYEGIGRPDNQWVYNGEGDAYIRCFLFATKIATSIGKNPPPQNEGEYLFMTVSWLSGVFIFAMLIGQIRDILYVDAAQRRSDYRKIMDRTMVYMKRLNLAQDLRDRTRLWFNFNWDQQKSFDDGRILSKLPLKMQVDIAMHVHYFVLNKVKLFQDFDRTLLRDIVLRLKPYLYLPGGYICRKGEVGTEMYIVNDGQVNVMGGEKDDVVMASLGKGSVFGEISLLATGLGNRRTANVRSRGYSHVFVLSKADLHDAIKDYPMAQETLRRRSRKLFRTAIVSRGNDDDDDDGPVMSDSSSLSIPSLPASPSTPKLLRTVLQVVSSNSIAANLIRKGSRSWHGFNISSVPSNPTPQFVESSLESSVPDLPKDSISVCSGSSSSSSSSSEDAFITSAVGDLDSDNVVHGGRCQTCISMPSSLSEFDVGAASESATINVDEYVDSNVDEYVDSSVDENVDSSVYKSCSANTIECPVTVHRPRTPVQ